MPTSEQGVAYGQLVLAELDAQRSRRSATVERLARVQQSAALPVSLVAAAGSLVKSGTVRTATTLLAVGALVLVIAVVVASLGLSRNSSLLAKPSELEAVVRAGWQDDPVDARFAVVVHQIGQLRALSLNNDSLVKWATAAGWLQLGGLGFVAIGAFDLLIRR